MKLLSFVLLLTCCLDSAISFAIVKSNVRNPSSSTPKLSNTLLYSSIGSMLPDNNNDDMLLIKAKECAYSASSTVKDMNQYLNQIIEIQSNCMSGNIEAGLNDICQNVDEITEIVAQLRYKLSSNERTDRMLTTGEASSMDAPSVLESTSLLLIGLFILASISVTQNQWESPTVPFTTEEWIYAMKGGYLNQMILHYIRNGGI